MSENQFDELTQQLGFLGFDEGLHHELKEKLKQGASFELPYVRQIGRDLVQSVLFFGYGTTGKYYFNRYSMTIHGEGAADPLQQIFFISRSFVRFSFTEAYNLLKGRSVFKEKCGSPGKTRPAWLRLNDNEVDDKGNRRFHIYSNGYGYDLAAELAKYPVAELSDAEASSKLLYSLERGNRSAVTLIVNGKAVAFYAEAVPQFKSLDFYDSSHQRIAITKVVA